MTWIPAYRLARLLCLLDPLTCVISGAMFLSLLLIPESGQSAPSSPAVMSWMPFAGAISSKPTQVDLEPNFVRWGLPLKNQRSRNTCSVMSMTAGMEYALSRKLLRGVQLSPEYLNWACNQIIGNTKDDRGQFFHHLLQGYEKFGICEEARMPYSSKFNPDYHPSHAATNSARSIKAMGLRAHWIKTNNGKTGITAEHLEEIKDALRAGWPVCAGSYHSLLITGFIDLPQLPGGGEFKVRDSGGGGEKTMNYETARKRLCDLIWFDTGAPAKPVTGGP